MQFRLASACLAILTIASHVRAASIVVVPDDLFQGKRARISQLMPDGKSIMGVAGDEVFRWTKEFGRTTIGYLGPRVMPTAISADGTTVIGRYVNWNDTQAIRWTTAGGLEILPRIPGLGGNASATHVSDDGSLVYGTANLYPARPVWDLYLLGELSLPFDFDDIHPLDDIEVVFRSHNVNGTQPLAEWSRFAFQPSPQMTGVSADGQIVAGMADDVPVLQTENAGPFQSPIEADEIQFASVSKLSADGTTVIGTYYTTFRGLSRVFRWTPGETFQPLTDATEISSEAVAISADGRTILGRLHKTLDSLEEWVIWQEGREVQSLQDYFAMYGVSLPFSGTHDVSEMSRDGLVFYGSSTEQVLGPENVLTYRTTQWIVDLTAPAPEPSTIVVVASGVLAFALGRRKRLTEAGDYFLAS